MGARVRWTNECAPPSEAILPSTQIRWGAGANGAERVILFPQPSIGSAQIRISCRTRGSRRKVMRIIEHALEPIFRRDLSPQSILIQSMGISYRLDVFISLMILNEPPCLVSFVSTLGHQLSRQHQEFPGKT
jgi:hypothetical protein